MKRMVMLGKYPVDKVVDSVEKLGFPTDLPEIHLFFQRVNWWVFPEVYSIIIAVIRVTETLFSHRKIYVFAENIGYLYKHVSFFGSWHCAAPKFL